MKKYLKPIIASSLMAAAFGALTLSTTYALFTSNAETNITVESGIVKVTATAGNLLTYSCEVNSSGDRIDEHGAKYISKATEVAGVFTNGGTASLSSGLETVSLKKMTPGDRVTFNVNLGSETNVDYKYRINYKYVGSDNTIAKGLVSKIKIGSADWETYAGLAEYTSAWSSVITPSAELPQLAFDIELPIDKGNVYQNRTGAFMLTIEAVQGNAATGDAEAEVAKYTEDAVSPKSKAETGEDTILVASAGSVSVKTTIPANTAEVPAETDVQLVVSDIMIEEEPTSKSGTTSFNATLYVDGVEQATFTSPVAVEVQLPKMLEIISFKHNGTAITNYVYDATTGKLTFSTTSFSPFEVVYKKMTRNTMYGFYDSYVEDGHWVHEISTKAHFKNIFAHINLRENLSAADVFNDGTIEYALCGKTVEYVIIDDINFEGSLWTAEEIASSPIFQGTLKSGLDRNVVLSNANLTETGHLLASDWNNTGLLIRGYNATIQGITLDNIDANVPGGKGVGLFLSGYNKAISGSEASYLNIIDCVTNANCEVNSSANSGAFVGSIRYITNVLFEGCVNNANVSCGSTNIGAFAGTGTSMSGIGGDTLTFINCVNNGNITGSDFVGGLTGNTGNDGRQLLGTGNRVNGNITPTSGTNYGMFFSGNSWYKLSNSSFEGTFAGHILLANVPSTMSNFEYAHFNDFTYTISDGNGESITKANYINYVLSTTVEDLEISFDANNKLVIEEIDCDQIIVNVRQHGLQLLKSEYVNYDGDKQTSELGGPQQSEKHSSIYVDTFASIEAAHNAITKVTQCGYFMPNGALDIKCSYGAGFNTFKLGEELRNVAGYEQGYHIAANGTAYIVMNPADSVADYLAICDWRNEVKYEITAKKNGQIVGNGAVYWGRDYAHGDATFLLPVTCLG